MTYTSYALSKALREFLKESAPEPMQNADSSYCVSCKKCNNGANCKNKKNRVRPIYSLHDLLSRPFVEAMAKKRYNSDHYHFPEIYRATISDAYYNGSLPAVETALMEMMKESKK